MTEIMPTQPDPTGLATGMRKRSSRVELVLSHPFESEPKELPFVIGVLADFAGKHEDASEPLEARRFFQIDRDTFDARLKQLKPRLVFQVPNALSGDGYLTVDLNFESLADFEPAAVACRIPVLKRLLEARRQLTAEARSNRPEQRPIPDIQPRELDIQSEFNRTPMTAARSDFEALLEQPVGEAGSSGDPRITELDRRLSAQLNLILHHEDFRQLEGTWRGLNYLVQNTETDALLKIKILCITKRELQQTAGRFAGTLWDQSPLFENIYTAELGTPGGDPFGCLIGDFFFDHSPQDITALNCIARIAAAAQAPFITGAASSLLGLQSWQHLKQVGELTRAFERPDYASWRALRDSAESRFLALTCPRMLARHPYQRDAGPPEEFGFDEDTAGSDTATFVWANSAFAIGTNIARAFKLYGWCANIRGFESGGCVVGLATHCFPDETGGMCNGSPTEVAITNERIDFELVNLGLMPVFYAARRNQPLFLSAQTLQKPKRYAGKGAEDANITAQLLCRLPYVFVLARWAHYIQCILRDEVRLLKPAELQLILAGWLETYVLRSSVATPEQRAQRPLAEAKVEVSEISGQPGAYKVKVLLVPHFQLEAPVPFPLTFVWKPGD